MTILITTIPDEPDEWAGWLEQILVGLRLRDLVTELRLVPGMSSKSLNELLDEQSLTSVRQKGLSALSVDQIRTLFNAPGSLLELQEDVMLHGGDYWTTIAPQTELTAAVERVSERLNATLREETWRAGNLPHGGAGFRRAIMRRSLFVQTSVAVACLIGVMLWQLLGKPGLVANNADSSADYLNRIADVGNEWIDQHPQNSTQLIAMLQHVSNACQILIDADHESLTPAERDWLVTKFTKWKKAFDATLAALQSGRSTLEDAKTEADATMMELVKVLKAGPPV